MGRRESGVVHPLAFCRTCGITFESTQIALPANSTDIYLFDNSVICPSGHVAEMLDGHFSTINGTLKVLGGTRFTYEQVRKLNALKNQVRDQAISTPHGPIPQEFLEALKEISPSAAAAVTLLKDKKYGWGMLLFFMTLLLSQCGGDAPLIDLSTHNETHYHIERPLNPQQPGEQEYGSGTHAPGDGSKAENRESDGFGNLKLVHKSTFRQRLLSSTAMNGARTLS